MTVQEALKTFQDNHPVIVGDKTVQPNKVDEVQLETGEKIFWIQAEDHMWLSLDPNSDEMVVFQDIEETFDITQESLLYANDDYEFTFESSAKMIDEDGESESITFKDYEESTGKILRLVSYEVTGDFVSSLGFIVPEAELQAV